MNYGGPAVEKRPALYMEVILGHRHGKSHQKAIERSKVKGFFGYSDLLFNNSGAVPASFVLYHHDSNTLSCELRITYRTPS